MLKTKSNIFSLILMALIFLLLTLPSYASQLTLKAGTPIPVRLLESVDSETATAGQTVRFLVTRDVPVNGIVVIKAGSEASGEVTYSQKTGSLGKEGKVFVVIRYATAVNGTKVPLRANLSRTGNEQVAMSFMICPFIKGTSSVIPADTETKAYVDYDTIIK